MQRSLSHNKFSGRIETGNKIGIDIIRSFLVVSRLKFDPGMVVRQNIGETIFGSVDRHISCRARFFSTNVFQFFVFFGKAEIRIRAHNSVVFTKIFQLDRFGGFNKRILKGNIVAVPHITRQTSFQTGTSRRIFHPANSQNDQCN